jgi:hypothetical protein
VRSNEDTKREALKGARVNQRGPQALGCRRNVAPDLVLSAGRASKLQGLRPKRDRGDTAEQV